MQEQLNPTAETTIGYDDVRVVLGETTALTLGSGGGTSEDKRYVYN